MIRLEQVSFSYTGGPSVIRELSAVLPERGLVRLCGPSGCGKSTLLHLICGLRRPTSGQVLGVEPGQAAVVFQEDRLLPWCSIQENVAAVSDTERARQALAQVELENFSGKLPAELSGGQRRRAALARALAYSGRFLALDEPFTGLDRPLALRLLALLQREAEQRMVVVISHDLEMGEILQLWPAGPPEAQA